jgi:hypothetical protein
MMRLRITFSKTGSLRYTGHLDLQTVWERTARRAGLPLAYTQGFHPGPRIQIASALPLGFAGHAEIVDIWLKDNVGAGLVPAQPPTPAQGDHEGRPYAEMSQPVDNPTPYVELLQPAAPPGLTILSVEQVDEKGPALQTQVASAEYLVTLLEPATVPDLDQRVSRLLATASLPRERRGKPYDLRPLIEELALTPMLGASPTPPPPGEGQEVRLFMRLSAREAATGRPEEVLDVLGIPFETTRIERMRLILKDST